MSINYLRDPRLNKGLAFSLEERQYLRIHGLQPPRFKTQEEQVELCKQSVLIFNKSLNKYAYLADLQDRNERLFFRLLSENIELLMPIVYTPTVGLACQKFGLIYRRPRGLFITSDDRGHCYDIFQNWPEHDVKAICVTDGERILGLGDLGAYGMGIPVGKLALYTALAGVKPHQCLPIVLDVGTNTTKLLDDPLYIGLRQRRLTGAPYDSFVDEFMAAAVKRYGQNVLIQFEDFGNPNAFRLLDKYRDKYCMFNDDIQGTGSVVVSGLQTASRISGKRIWQNTFLFLGAGEAAMGIANLCVTAMIEEGLAIEEARGKIWMFDHNGLLAFDRPEGSLNGYKQFYAKDHRPLRDFAALVYEVKPSVLIGVSTCGGAFTPAILKAMAAFNDRPIIFPLSNPTANAECTAEDAYLHTDGRCIFASGSPFPPVKFGKKTFLPGQGNNAYIYPGVGLGVILSGVHHVDDELFIIASQCVADNVSESDLAVGRIYPPVSSIRECSIQIATRILEYAYKKGIATVYPEPANKRQYVLDNQYNYKYEPALPNTWTWPKQRVIKTTSLEGLSFD